MSALREILAAFHIEVETKELKEGEKGIQEFAEKLKKLGESIAVALGVESVREFIKGQIEAATSLKVTASRLGTNTDELQVMRYAADQAGVSADSLTTGLRLLNKHISEASGASGKGSALFRELGISLKNADGSTRSSTEIMGVFADAVAKIPSAAKQTEVAIKLLGRGGADLIPLLKEGGAAFDEARKQIAELGGVMSEEFIEKAHKAEQAEKRMQYAVGSLKTEIASALLPTFERQIAIGTRMVINLIDMAKHTGVVKAAFAGLAVIAAAIAPVMSALAFGGALLYAAFDELYVLLAGGKSLIGDSLGPDKEAFVKTLKEAVWGLKDALGGSNTELGNASTGWEAFRIIVVGAAKALATVASFLDSVLDKLALLGDLIGSMSTDEEGAGRSWGALKARWADEGTGGHENLRALHKGRNDKAQADYDKEEKFNDTEKQKKDWMVAERYRKEFEDKKSEWESGGKRGPAPVMQPELAEFFANRPDPYGDNGAPSALARPNWVEVGGAPAGAAGTPGADGKGVIFNQTNNIEMHGSADPTAGAQQVATQVGTTTKQFAMSNALTAVTPP